MFNRTCLLFLTSFLCAGPAAADLHLSQKQCNEYPFKPATHITQRGLRRELAELEAVGYRPAQSDVYYPDDVQQAEQKLRAVNRRDCLGTSAPPSADASQ